MTVPKPKNNLVIAHDVYTGTTVPHLFPVIGSHNYIIPIYMDNIVQLWFYIDCGYDGISSVEIFPNQYGKDWFKGVPINTCLCWRKLLKQENEVLFPPLKDRL